MIGASLVAISLGTAVIGSLAVWFFGVRACAASARPKSSESELLCGVLQIVAITSAMALVFVYVDQPSFQRFPEAALPALGLLTTWPAVAPLYALYICIGYPLLFAPAMIGALFAAFAGLCIGTAKSPRLARCWPFAVIGVFAAVFLLAGEYQFRRHLQHQGEVLRVDCMDALPFWRALLNNGSSRQLHAEARKAGKRYAWSFSRADFYPIPVDVGSYVRPPLGAVGTLPSCLPKT